MLQHEMGGGTSSYRQRYQRSFLGPAPLVASASWPTPKMTGQVSAAEARQRRIARYGRADQSVTRYHERTLATIVGCWRRFLVTRQWRRGQVETSRRFGKWMSKVATFRVWREAYSTTARWTVVSSKISQRRYRRTLLQTFGKWSCALRQGPLLDGPIHRRKNSSSLIAQVDLEVHWLRAVGAAVARRIARHFDAWHRLLEDVRNEWLAEEHLIATVISDAFEAWSLAACHSQHMRAGMIRVCLRRALRLMRACFHLFVSNASEGALPIAAARYLLHTHKCSRRQTTAVASSQSRMPFSNGACAVGVRRLAGRPVRGDSRSIPSYMRHRLPSSVVVSTVMRSQARESDTGRVRRIFSVWQVRECLGMKQVQF
jgi:hypothetical protein